MTVRETLLARTFVDVADTLVADFDVVDFLTILASRCAELFEGTEAGLMLADPEGGLRVAASSSLSMQNLELFEIQHDEGPCVDSYRTGEAVVCPNLESEVGRWSRFGPEALRVGFRSVYALPMRLRDTTIGSLNLLRLGEGALDTEDLVAAQALADVATIGLLHHRAAEDSRTLTRQLQYALNSRVVIEQAKGVVAQLGDLSMDRAFETMRRYSRDHNRRLSDVARAIIERSLPAADVLASDPAPS